MNAHDHHWRKITFGNIILVASKPDSQCKFGFRDLKTPVLNPCIAKDCVKPWHLHARRVHVARAWQALTKFTVVCAYDVAVITITMDTLGQRVKIKVFEGDESIGDV